ncbi:ABC transporter binding protein [Pseudomonas aeruginosa]|nr:ABC transporter binding protein [Pseudomonas aeruginosa]
MRPRSALRYSLLLLAFAASAAIQAQPKTLAVCTEAAPEGFDPARYTSGYTFDASAHPLYNALAAFAPGSATVIPALAESWDVSADGLVYTFRLRQGVKFHSTEYFKPSREFNADDVLFSFQRMLDPQHPAHDLSPSGYPYADAMQLRDIIERIEKIDEHQVRFVLKHPEAPFLADLAMPFGSILSAEYAGQLIARARATNSTASRSAPARSSSPATARMPRCATRPTPTTGRASRPSTTWCWRSPSIPTYACSACVATNARSP